MANKQIEKMLQGLTILVQRRLTRTMLTNLGAKSVLEAPDGLAALEAIRIADPDVMLLDWDCRSSTASRSCASFARPVSFRDRTCRS
ncbi:MAG: response regulator [Pseudolabrys sp.]